MVIEVDAVTRVSGLWMVPPDATACFVVAHGAGAGMRQPFMENLAGDLAALRIATLRYQFPYMERGSRRTDPPARCHATVRAAVAAAGARLPSLPLFAGGKSFGGRMTSQAQAAAPLPQVRGLIFLGFPLHPPKAPSVERGGHLFDVRIPMLFVQGARDEFAELPLLNALLQRLGGGSTLCLLPQADHSFKVPARAAVSRTQVHDDMLAALTAWIGALA
jgi:predicted alpha/beta-hydrolase family hydrolase